MEQPLEIAEAKGLDPMCRRRRRSDLRGVSFAYRPDDPILRNLSFVPLVSMWRWWGRPKDARAPSSVCSAACTTQEGASWMDTTSAPSRWRISGGSLVVLQDTFLFEQCGRQPAA